MGNCSQVRGYSIYVKITLSDLRQLTYFSEWPKLNSLLRYEDCDPSANDASKAVETRPAVDMKERIVMAELS